MKKPLCKEKATVSRNDKRGLLGPASFQLKEGILYADINPEISEDYLPFKDFIRSVFSHLNGKPFHFVDEKLVSGPNAFAKMVLGQDLNANSCLFLFKLRPAVLLIREAFRNVLYEQSHVCLIYGLA